MIRFPVLLLKYERPEQSLAGELRLIREDPFQVCEQLFRQAFVVVLVRDLEKFPHNFRIEVVDVVGIDLIVAAQQFSGRSGRQGFAEQFERRGIVPGDRVRALFRLEVGRVEKFITQIFLLILHAESVHEAAAESARPAVFVVEPAGDAAFSRFVEAGSHALHPFVGEVCRAESAACVHEESAESGRFHLTHLAAQFFGFELVVPAPEWDWAVLRRRVVQIEIGDRHLNDSFI